MLDLVTSSGIRPGDLIHLDYVIEVVLQVKRGRAKMRRPGTGTGARWRKVKNLCGSRLVRRRDR